MKRSRPPDLAKHKSEELSRRMYAEYKAGDSLSTIAKRHGLSRHPVWKRIDWARQMEWIGQ